MTDFSFPPRVDPVPAAPPIAERMTPAQAAEYLGVSEHTLRNWRASRTGPTFYAMGRVFYWRRDLDAFLASRRVICT